MAASNLFMAIVPAEHDAALLHQIAKLLGYNAADIVVGEVKNAVTTLVTRSEPPRQILLDIGDKGTEILPGIDSLAEHCVEGTQVIVVGKINDVKFYRELRARGVIEYFTHPIKAAEIFQAFSAQNASMASSGGKVMTFMSAASGDGASTIALNTAYALATECNKSVVLVDMDYQFGMAAKNLDLTASFGIKELFDHPERGIDATLLSRMLVGYGNSKLSIIAAPNELDIIPHLSPDLIRELVYTLRQSYDVVILDLPHIWNPWIATSISLADKAVLVAQLWLRSVTHSARLLAAWRSNGINNNNIVLTINRSGAKFKEAISARDFERVCALPIKYYFINDIRSIVSAENQGKTILEGGNSAISKQLKEFAVFLNSDK